jgi:molybdopterin molybdotransferase
MSLIEIHEAIRILADATSPLDKEDIDLQEARGRVLAETIRADRDFPPTDRSAMDGFAVRAADLAGAPCDLRVVGEVAAGSRAGGIELGPGQAARIFTGGVVPHGADAVVMVERTTEDLEAGSVTVDVRPEPGAHVRRRGEEIAAGEVLLRPGTVLAAPEIAALASVGRTRLQVHRRPVVRVLATGDELIDPAAAPQDHQVRNSNSATLLAQLADLGIAGQDLGIAPDDRQALGKLLRRGLSADLLLVTGGVSVGRYDLVGQALAEAGMTLLFHKVRIKPGKPVLAGRCGECLVIGLPGNPVSAYAGFAVFVAPALRRLTGCRRWANPQARATLDGSLRQVPGRTTYHLARLETSGDRLVARVVNSRGSGDLISMTRANGFVIAPAEAREIPAGTDLPALLWRDFQYR